ncbi:MAG: branched-chain amino acid ABC transporter permease [Candidatus Omnitrophota bacterium]|nr:branched-chain amino acid ABC transporter permease [Candidatus Omnitrophota bacterium]
MSHLETFLQQLINGLTIGMIYALIALGYTMVYGIIQLINFAHGEIFITGAFFGLAVFSLFPSLTQWNSVFTLVLMFCAAMAGCGLLGVVIERIAYRPLRKAPRLACLITAIGISFILQNVLMLIWGPVDKSFPAFFKHSALTVGALRITFMQGFIITTSLVMMIALRFFVTRTMLGKALRATSEDMTAARLMGINVDKVISVCFLIGSALGGAGGVMYGMYYNTISFHDGYLVGIKAFTAAVLGGIGNVPGAMLGGIALGMLEGLGAGYLSSAWKNVFAFLILVILLLCWPSGILRKSRNE